MTALDPGTWSAASDAELIAAVRAGDAHAYGELYARHSAAAKTVARQYVPRAADADDVVAEAFAKVLSVLQSGGGPDLAFRAYLFTVVRHAAYGLGDAARRQRPTDDWAMYESSFGVMASTEEPALESFERSVVTRAYRELPERWQAVLWYTEVEGLTPAQIAPLLGLTANGVSALAYRAREGLRQAYLQQHLTTTPDETCRRVHGLLGSYVRGGLAKRETAQVEAHLAECGGCKAFVLELGDVAHGMRSVIAPLVLGTAGLGLIGHALPLGGLAGAGAAGAAAGVGGVGAAGGAGVGGAAGAGAASAGAGAAGAGAAGAGAGAAGAGAGAAGAGAAGAGAGAAGAGAVATGSGMAGAAAVGGGAAAGAVGAGSAVTAGATGVAAFFAAAPVTAAIVTVGVTAAVGLGVAASLGAFSHDAAPPMADPSAPAVVTLAPATSPTASAPAPAAPSPDLTSPSTVAPVFPDATTPAPLLPTSAPTLVVAPVVAPTLPPPAPAVLALALDGSPSFAVGSSTPVSFTASNSGGTAAQGVAITVVLPSGMQADSSTLALAAGTGGGGSSGALARGAVRLDVPSGTCVSSTDGGTGNAVVTCTLDSLAAGASASVQFRVTPTARTSIDGFGWSITAQGLSTGWSGRWTPAAPIAVSSANLVPSVGSGVTVANPGEGDVTFGLANDGNAPVPSGATVALVVPDGVHVTSLTGGGAWTSVDASGGTVWRVPAGFSLGSGESTTLTAHVVADGSGGPSGTAPAGSGTATLTVRGAVADSTTPSAGAALVVEQPWQGASASTPALACVGPGQLGAATVTVPVVNGSSAPLTAVVSPDGSSAGGSSTTVAGGASGSVPVSVVYGGTANPGLTVTYQRTVDGVLRVATGAYANSVVYTADPCVPALRAGESERAHTLADPATTTLRPTVKNAGSVAATGLTATVSVPDGVQVAVGDGWVAGSGGVWTRSADLAPGDTATLPLTLTAQRAGVDSGRVQVTFAAADSPAGTAPASWSTWLHVERPWQGLEVRAAGLQCVGWKEPGRATLTVELENGSTAAVSAQADGTDAVTVGAEARHAKLAVPVTWDGHFLQVVDVTISRGSDFQTVRHVVYWADPCPGMPVLDAHAGDAVSTANPSRVTVTATVTNDGTARALGLVARLDLPGGYTVRGVSGDFSRLGSVIVANRSLGVGETASLRLDLAVDVRRDGAGTDAVGVTFDAWGASASSTSVPVTTEARWPVSASAVAQCDGTVTVTVTNGSASAVSVSAPRTDAAPVPGHGSGTIQVRVDRDHGRVPAGVVHVTVRRDGYTTTVDAAYAAPDCTDPGAVVASVGQCAFDRGTQRSSAPVTILLDNRRSSVAVRFTVDGPGGATSRTVGAGAKATVQRTVGEGSAVFTVRGAGETFTLPVAGVDCVPDFHAWHHYDKGDRVRDGSSIYVSRRDQLAVADPHTVIGRLTWDREGADDRAASTGGATAPGKSAPGKSTSGHGTSGGTGHGSTGRGTSGGR